MVESPDLGGRAMDFTGTLSRRERQIVDILYRKGRATVAEVMEEMADPPSYSAVRTTLRILEEKGHVTHVADGPRYVYSPAVAPDSARKDALRHLVKTFFDGSPERAAVALLKMSDTLISEDQVERVRKEIHKAEEEGR
jgi:predicted transcriptional regulator